MIGRAQVFEQLKNVQAETGRSGDSLAIEIGRRLGAWWVVSGAYQRIGDRIRITAQLVEVLKGTLLRTVKIDGRVDEIFELQDRIVFDLSRSLNVKLGKAEADAIERDETSSVEAFEAYSRGVLNLRSAGRDAIDRAIALFERAVQLDPKYASAWAALGGAYTLKGGFLGMPQLLEKAIEPLRRALGLNPTLVNAHVWLGSALAGSGRLDEGLASLRKAVEIEPDNADAHQTLARAYWLSKGMVPEGIAELRKALALNPEAGYTHLQLSMLEALSGNLDAAEAVGASGDRAAGAGDVGHRRAADRRRARAAGLRALPARRLRCGVRRVPPRAGVGEHERPRAARAHADRAASEDQRGASTRAVKRPRRFALAISRFRRTRVASPPAPTIPRRATTSPRCTRGAATSSTRASIWRCR